MGHVGSSSSLILCRKSFKLLQNRELNWGSATRHFLGNIDSVPSISGVLDSILTTRHHGSSNYFSVYVRKSPYNLQRARLRRSEDALKQAEALTVVSFWQISHQNLKLPLRGMHALDSWQTPRNASREAQYCNGQFGVFPIECDNWQYNSGVLPIEDTNWRTQGFFP